MPWKIIIINEKNSCPLCFERDETNSSFKDSLCKVKLSIIGLAMLVGIAKKC